MNSTTYVGYADRTSLDSNGQLTSSVTFASSLEVCFSSAQGDNVALYVLILVLSYILFEFYKLDDRIGHLHRTSRSWD